MGWAQSPTEFLSRAEEMANKALNLNESEVRARIFLGRIHLFYHRYEQAKAEMDRAIATNPNDAHGLTGRGNILMWLANGGLPHGKKDNKSRAERPGCGEWNSQPPSRSRGSADRRCGGRRRIRRIGGTAHGAALDEAAGCGLHRLRPALALRGQGRQSHSAAAKSGDAR